MVVGPVGVVSDPIGDTIGAVSVGVSEVKSESVCSDFTVPPSPPRVVWLIVVHSPSVYPGLLSRRVHTVSESGGTFWCLTVGVRGVDILPLLKGGLLSQ